MADVKNDEKLGRRERERLARRSEIIAAARKVFAAKGYSKATVEEIAAEAEFAKGTIYGYFDGKRDLFLQMVDGGFDEIAGIVRTVLASAEDFENGIRSLVAAELDYIDKNRDFFNIMMSYRSADPEHIRELQDLMMRRLPELADLVGEYIRRGIDAGVIKDYDPRYLAMRLLAGAHDYAISVFRGYADYTLDEGTDIVFDLFFNGIRVGEKR